MDDILNLSESELLQYIQAKGYPGYRGKQILRWLYKKNVGSFDAMNNLPQTLREALAQDFFISHLEPVGQKVSCDQTVKFLFALHDQERIETAVIPTEKRTTVCVSTQAGCRFACCFCASGLNGFKRQLTCGEIIAQILHVQRYYRDKKITHLVFMGVGEPLDNYEQVLKAIRMINSPTGLQIAARRITISTCGLVPEIRKLSKENLQIELAVSLHAPNNAIRNRLMPVNKKYPMDILLNTCRRYAHATKRQVTFEYLLIKNLTCTPQAAKELGRLLGDKLFKMNLLMVNEVKELGWESPGKVEILAFQQALNDNGLHATLRIPRGRDIEAACGQLRYMREKKT